MNLDRCFIIAEMSANHGSKLEIALETVRAAARAGADAIKLQTYRGDTITMDSKTQDFLIEGTLWSGRYLYDLYEEAHLPWKWHKAIFDEAKKEGLVCFSSPFDFTAVDFLEELQCPIYKIASFEITDIPLIEYVASKGKPVIISTGIADDKDIQLAVDSCRKMDNHDITLLKCTSSYPAPIALANLSMIPDLAIKFDVSSGLSDHTEGIVAPIVAVSLGAKVIEKHFILDKSVGGPDASFSLDEKQFTEMVNAVRDAEKSIGKIDYSLTENQKQNRKFARSLYVVEDIKAGEKITTENVRSIRPG
ncbi:pseudaminic acid synthase, partial [uncultured Roseivirga sp.]|uniref:pseudaminic acid synthase n=1 Tax=uncultured Roseivirga sp. TaxID=543088 RepID=UPI0030D95DE8